MGAYLQSRKIAESLQDNSSSATSQDAGLNASSEFTPESQSLTAPAARQRAPHNGGDYESHASSATSAPSASAPPRGGLVRVAASAIASAAPSGAALPGTGHSGRLSSVAVADARRDAAPRAAPLLAAAKPAASHHRAAASAPSDPNAFTHCRTCDAFRPPRAHHCHACGRCVLKVGGRSSGITEPSQWCVR